MSDHDFYAMIWGLGFLGFGLFVLLFFQVLEWKMGYDRWRRSVLNQPEPCQHRGGHTTSFEGMDEMRALFSGKMSPEEYSKLAGGFGSYRTCNSCGERLD